MGVDILPLGVDFGSLGVDFRTLCERMFGVWEPNCDLVRNACKIKKAHILSPRDRGVGGGAAIAKLSLQAPKMSFFVGNVRKN